MSGAAHTYRARLAWAGSTGVGYEAYDRAHRVWAPPAEAALDLAADPAFLGDAALLNPEQLLVAAASSCQLLSFLAVAARARLDVVAYQDDALAVMPDGPEPLWITRIELRPVITLAGAGAEGTTPTDERLAHLVEVAHRGCYIANSLRTEVDVSAAFVRSG